MVVLESDIEEGRGGVDQEDGGGVKLGGVKAGGAFLDGAVRNGAVGGDDVEACVSLFLACDVR